MTSNDVKKQSKDVATQVLTLDQLRNVLTFEDAVALAKQVNDGVIISSADLGDGFAIKEKKDLIGIQMMLLEWEQGKNVSKGEGFIIVRAVTVNNDKVIFTDGSTGIWRQLTQFTEQTGRTSGMYAQEGLRVSRYTFTDETGKEKDAETYYIA